MRAINSGAINIAFVGDESGRIVGTLSDGDVRRAILGGADLNTSRISDVMRGSFTSVGVDAGRAEVLDLMRALYISAVPVLDESRRLVSIHLLRELLGSTARENWAVVLAGGQGVRLRPLTENIPKPMLPVAGRPILERLVLHLVGYGVGRVYISVNYLAHIIEDHFGDGSRFGCEIHYLREDRPLGTGGPLSLLPEEPTAPVIVMNGDLVTQANLGALLDFHAQGNYAATIGVRPYRVEVPFGVADVEEGTLVRLQEKPTYTMLVNAGIYGLSPEAIRLIPKATEFPITELFGKCQEKSLRVGAHVVEDEWADIGRPDELKRARGLI